MSAELLWHEYESALYFEYVWPGSYMQQAVCLLATDLLMRMGGGLELLGV